MNKKLKTNNTKAMLVHLEDMFLLMLLKLEITVDNNIFTDEIVHSGGSK